MMSLFSKKSKLSKATTYAFAPFSGITKSLESIGDGILSEKIMGDGVLVSPYTNVRYLDVLSPISGEVIQTFPTSHAYQIRNQQGVIVLVQIGLKCDEFGHGIEPHVKKGQTISVGDKLATINLPLLREKAEFNGVIIIVVSGHEVWNKNFGDVSIRDKLFTTG